jgi:hypothetical protein
MQLWKHWNLKMSDHLVKPPYIAVENRKTGVVALKLTEQPFEGIIISYGKVDFNEQGDTCKLHFEYDVHESPVDYDRAELEHYLGDLLQFLIMDQLSKNEIIYTGGIDENRNKDSEQSDL